ncbi:MAG: hypothetical protein PHI38_06805 [Sulfurimonas sp.]|uniref:hypothetical protein n=1 Tax=Sulfurimonas sp. TaxID=2022749 RepID=UPI00260EAE4D|nr:hypothetical protein [Sulfurimonas sp.]MDD3476561.1 hypothetical protein [Sulfurimonas sp.]
MTRKQMQANAKKYMVSLKKDLDQEIVRLIDSGAIDFDLEDPRSFGMVKAICKAAMENVADKVSHFSSETKKDYLNLKKF